MDDAAHIQELIGARLVGASTTSDDNGTETLHLLFEGGRVLKVVPGDPGYLDITEYRGWTIPRPH